MGTGSPEMTCIVCSSKCCKRIVNIVFARNFKLDMAEFFTVFENIISCKSVINYDVFCVKIVFLIDSESDNLFVVDICDSFK